MLITLYEDTTPTNFNQDFAENIILPRNAELKLLSAFCNRLPLVDIDATTDTITLIANDKNWSGVQVAIPTGSYDAKTLMETISGLLATINTDNNLQLRIKLVNMPSLNYNAGALRFELIALSLHYDQDNIVYFTHAPTDKTTWASVSKIVETPVVDFVVRVWNYGTDYGENVLGITDTTDAVPSTIVDIRKCVNFDKEKIDRNWYSANPNGTDTSRPPLSLPYGMVSFLVQKLTSTGLNWWVGLTNSTPDLTNMFASNVDALDDMKGMNYIVYFEGVGGTTFTPTGTILNAGDFLVGEYLGGSWTWTKYSSIAEGDDFAFVLPQGTNRKLEISHRASGSSWTILDTSHFASLDDATPYNFVFGAEQNTNSLTAGLQQIYNLEMTSKQSYTHLDDMGQYIEMDFSTDLAEKLGLSNSPYKSDTTGTPDKAVLKFENDKSATTKINSTEPPFVQVNINNLPVKSYTRRDTRQTDGFKANTSSRCIANISRFDADGGYNGHLVDVGNNQPLIKLHNAEELTLSQLRVRLTNVDGTLPQDLSPPFCANIEITEGK